MTHHKTTSTPQPIDQLSEEGWLVLPQILGPDACHEIRGEIEQLLTSHAGDAVQSSRRQARQQVVGGRNLLSRWDGWRRLFQSTRLEAFVSNILGNEAGLVRILFFDKPPGEGWSLAMHQDRTIAVQQHQTPAAPFSKPTRKAGVPHVEASEELLREMITLRVHLDPMHQDNGPLVVAPGTHRGFAAPMKTDGGSGLKTIACDAGDVFVMRPLLAHGSLAATPGATDHRRVVHLELSNSQQLPGNYEWHQFVPLFDHG